MFSEIKRRPTTNSQDIQRVSLFLAPVIAYLFRRRTQSLNGHSTGYPLVLHWLDATI